MILTITRRQYNKSGQYNERSYMTKDEEIILEYLDAYADNSIDAIEWIEDNLSHFEFNGNCMSIGFNSKDDDKVEYIITTDNGDKKFVDKLERAR